jgi:hypothetical protein
MNVSMAITQIIVYLFVFSYCIRDEMSFYRSALWSIAASILAGIPFML